MRSTNSTAAWRKIRTAYVVRHLLCECCDVNGRLTPLSHGGTHDEDNLMSLLNPRH
ncbi:hypothetical protein [Canibacter zhoujuaniae]|nr:hypothetical protein [Canibacter zhoujuaniae]